jgi:hypothetical protein
VVSHPDDDEGCRRSFDDEVVQRADAVGSENRLVDDHHRRGDALQ